ncbi:tyrosine-type recombinase/integrase [Agromyces sp. CCNWLW203]|uniref:tyrosine-type recombinase/integrase n=1 Tax=Agromyces sp. CCNWLW203 TaxID=3112842 RepID=UPI002F964D6D
MHSDHELLAAYATFRSASGHKRSSIAYSEGQVRRMLARTGKTLMTVTREDLIGALAVDVAPHTKRLMRSAYRGVHAFLQDEGYRSDNPAERLPKQRVPRREAHPVSTAELQTLLMSSIHQRTRLYVLLYAYQGMRAAEIAAVSSGSIDWQRRRILTLNAKGDVLVWRPLHPIVWDELQYHRRDGNLFPGVSDGHVRPATISTVLARALRRAGITGHRPHQLRAWFATQQLEAGVSGPVAQANMRHADASSMKYYYLPSEDALRSAIELLPRVHVPRGGKRGATRARPASVP